MMEMKFEDQVDAVLKGDVPSLSFAGRSKGRGRPSLLGSKKEPKNSSYSTTKPGEKRHAFIVSEDHVSRIKQFAKREKKEIKSIVYEAFDAYLSEKRG